MQKSLLLSLILAVSACGDNQPPPPMTWADAEGVWAEAACVYYERCYDDDFIYTYGDQEMCQATVLRQRCLDNLRTYKCDELYPAEREESLQLCSEQMLTLACGSYFAPRSCGDAFQQYE